MASLVRFLTSILYLLFPGEAVSLGLTAKTSRLMSYMNWASRVDAHPLVRERMSQAASSLPWKTTKF